MIPKYIHCVISDNIDTDTSTEQLDEAIKSAFANNRDEVAKRLAQDSHLCNYSLQIIEQAILNCIFDSDKDLFLSRYVDGIAKSKIGAVYGISKYAGDEMSTDLSYKLKKHCQRIKNAR